MNKGNCCNFLLREYLLDCCPDDPESRSAFLSHSSISRAVDRHRILLLGELKANKHAGNWNV
jgi:hypothetical protein